jgi:beta-glucosidase
MSRFSNDFLWGAANAAYQVEGAAALDGRGPSIWDVFVRRPGATTRGDTGDVACDQYHRLEGDLDLMAELGLKLYRFSTSWSRVLPEGTGAVNEKGLDYYERLVDGLIARGIAPMLTLYHWDLPQALEEKGGWGSRDTAARFADFAGIVNRRLGDRVAWWCTVNEPWCTAFVGHRDGLHAPGHRDTGLALRAVHHQLLAHAAASERLRADGTAGRIGLALNLVSEHPATASPEDVAASRRQDGIENRIFLDPLFNGRYPEDVVAAYAGVTDFGFVLDGDLARISRPIDYLGVNYYEAHLTRAAPEAPGGASFDYPGRRRTAMHIGFNPEGLLDVLKRVRRDYGDLPIIVTENGMAFADYVDPEGRINDTDRIDYWRGHLSAVAAARAAGVDVRGYVAWSFLDNFEWQAGYSVRYGMVFVDYGTQRRIVKASGRWYAGVIADGGSTIP